MQKNTKFGMAKNCARPHFFPRAAGPKGARGDFLPPSSKIWKIREFPGREVDSTFDFFHPVCHQSVVQDSIYSFFLSGSKANFLYSFYLRCHGKCPSNMQIRQLLCSVLSRHPHNFRGGKRCPTPIFKCPSIHESNDYFLRTVSHTDLLACRLLVLPEEVVEDGAVLLVDALHLVYVLGNLQRGTFGQKSSFCHPNYN